MESTSTKEFLDKLNSGNLKPPAKLIGIAKKSGKESELLFAFKHDLSNWITIPESMIESVTVLKNISDKDNALLLVKLKLKPPSTPEAKILFDLLSILSAKVNRYLKIKWLKEMMFGEEMQGSSTHGHYEHPGMEGKSQSHSGKEFCNIHHNEH
jgi:hypothetical protein